jgi:hypothetical protein
VLDSKSGAPVLRRLACQQPRLESVAWDRVAIMIDYPGTRGWTLHDVRTLAKEVGALSKLHLAAFEKTEKNGWKR